MDDRRSHTGTTPSTLTVPRSATIDTSAKPPPIASGSSPFSREGPSSASMSLIRPSPDPIASVLRIPDDSSIQIPVSRSKKLKGFTFDSSF